MTVLFLPWNVVIEAVPPCAPAIASGTVRYGIATQSPASSTVITAEPWMVLASYGSMRSLFALAINTVPPESLLGYLIAVSK